MAWLLLCPIQRGDREDPYQLEKRLPSREMRLKETYCLAELWGWTRKKEHPDVDRDGNKYTVCQSESKLTRYRKVLSDEKEKNHLRNLEKYLS